MTKNMIAPAKSARGAIWFHLITWRHGRVEHDSTESVITPSATIKTEPVKNNNPKSAMAPAGDGSHEKNMLVFSFWSVTRTRRNMMLSKKILGRIIESVSRYTHTAGCKPKLIASAISSNYGPNRWLPKRLAHQPSRASRTRAMTRYASARINDG